MAVDNKCSRRSNDSAAPKKMKIISAEIRAGLEKP